MKPPLLMNLSGITAIDEQHAKLLETLSSLKLWMEKGKGDVAAFGTAAVLERYVHEHFRYEEHLMTESHYPGLSAQIEGHRAMQARVTQFAEDLIAGKSVTSDILVALEDWLTTHINEEALAFRQWPGMRDS